MKKHTKKVIVVFLAMIMAASLAACSGETEKASTETDTLKIAISSEPDNLSPMLSAATDTAGVMMNVFEGLLTFDTEGNFQPALAEKYVISDDGLTYTFNLRKDIKFHNDKAFTAADVKYTYEKLAGLDGSEPLSQILADELIAVETPDEYTVILKLNKPDAGFLSRCIISIQQAGYENDSTAPVGTGPYKFKEYIQGQKVILEKNPDYNTVESRIPEVQNVEFSVITDPNAVLMGVKSGSIDIAMVDPANLESVGDDYEIVEGLRNTVQLMAMNNSVAPFDNEKVRQAVQYAIDKDEIINTVMKGHGRRVESFLSPAMDAYFNKDLKGYETDVEKAKALLKEAGYENGVEFTITVPSNYQLHVDAAQVIKNQLEKAGFRVEINPVEWAKWLDQVYTKADYQASIVGHSGKLDPQDFLNRFITTYEKNYFKYSDPAYDKLVADASVTTDQSEREALYKQCQQELCDHAAAVFIEDPYIIYAVNKKFTGMQIYPVTFFDMGSIRIAK